MATLTAAARVAAVGLLALIAYDTHTRPPAVTLAPASAVSPYHVDLADLASAVRSLRADAPAPVPPQPAPSPTPAPRPASYSGPLAVLLVVPDDATPAEAALRVSPQVRAFCKANGCTWSTALYSTLPAGPIRKLADASGEPASVVYLVPKGGEFVPLDGQAADPADPAAVMATVRKIRGTR